MKKYYLTTWLIVMILPLLSACYDETEWENIPNGPFLWVEEETLNFDSPASSYTLQVRCNEEYAVGYGGGLESWCRVTKNETGDLLLELSENEEKNVRRGELYIQAVSQADTIPVAQLGWGKAILLSKATLNAPEVGGDYEVEITANVDYEFHTEACDWVTWRSVESRSAHETATKTFVFSIQANKGEARKVNIEVKDTDPNSDITPTLLLVNQRGLTGYNPDGSTNEEDDIKLTASSVTGDGGYRNTKVFENMLDGDLETFWQSDWSKPKFPQYIEFTFDEPQEMDYAIYYPADARHFKDVEIQVWSDVNQQRKAGYSTVFTGTLANTTEPIRINFDQPQAGVTKVKFILNSHWDESKEVQCREMEFYKKSPNNFDWRTLFAGPACTELKSGVSEEEILSCSHAFYKNLAWYMYNEKYPREFRIADYKAWPHPDVMSQENKTGTYSLLDNPTGIAVEANENLVVMADLKGRTDVMIRVQNLDAPGGDGFGGDDYTLNEGINTFTMKNKGLVYVMYHPDDYATAPEITIHFASGKVNGYYDSQNPALKDRWKELLTNATDKYFDVVGKYAHLTFPTARFQNHTKDGKALIDLYDELVYHEQEFMGLEKYKKMFVNRMYFCVIYTSFMYSTSYHTAYNESTLSYLTDETLLKSNCWGPAHEVGHSNQTRGLKWAGTMEVTNNILSLYIQTSVWGEPSRMEVDNNYIKSWNGIIVPRVAHGEVDPGFKLIPFWQLELYFGKVLGKTPMQQPDRGGFYPDVYQYLREHEDLSAHGAQQLEFVYNCCKASGMNLWDFFEKWGFLTPVDVELDDYGVKQLTITEADIENLKQRVDALGYPKPDVALEYISDYTVEDYRNRSEVIAGTSSRNGNVITLTNWQHVAAFEVKDASGNLVYISEGAAPGAVSREISLPVDWQDGFTVEAVSATNKRTKAL